MLFLLGAEKFLRF